VKLNFKDLGWVNMEFGILLIVFGTVHLIKPDIFYKSGLYSDPADIKMYRLDTSLLVLLVGALFILLQR
jgi:hypothetical protein